MTMNENMMNRSYEVQVGRLTGTPLRQRLLAGCLQGFGYPLLLRWGFAMTGTIFIYIPSVTGLWHFWPPSWSSDISPPGLRRCPWAWPGAYSSCMPPLTALYSAYLFAFSLEILDGIRHHSPVLWIMALIGWFGNINFTKLLSCLEDLYSCFSLDFAMFIDLSAFDTIVSTVEFSCSWYWQPMMWRRYRHSTHTTARRLRWQPRPPSSPLQLYLDFINLFVYIMRFWGAGSKHD